MKRSPWVWSSWVSTSRRSSGWGTKARLSPLLLLAPAWALLGAGVLALPGCYSAGQDASQGAFDEAEEWWEATGKGLAEDAAKGTATAAVEAGREELQKQIDLARKMLDDAWQARVEELRRKVEEGRAKTWEMVLYFLLAGLGAGGSRTAFDRFFGRKQGTSA